MGFTGFGGRPGAVLDPVLPQTNRSSDIRSVINDVHKLVQRFMYDGIDIEYSAETARILSGGRVCVGQVGRLEQSCHL